MIERDETIDCRWKELRKTKKVGRLSRRPDIESYVSEWNLLNL